MGSKENGRRSTGYLFLRERHTLNCLPHYVESWVTAQGGRHTKTVQGKIEETYPKSYWPGEGDFEHLEFALKYEGLHLQLLRSLLPRYAASEMDEYVRSKPTGVYARRIWFLYEAFTGIR